mgnify:CR=1 FL=1
MLSRNRDLANFMAAASSSSEEYRCPAADGSFLLTRLSRQRAGCLAVASCSRAELVQQSCGASFPGFFLPLQS